MPISVTARIHPDAQLGPDCDIGEYCVVEQDAVLGARTRLEPYVYVKRWTTLGADNEISAGTVLGTDPLDKAFSGARSYLRIGNRNKIREHYTISRGTQPESVTTIGDDNYIMTTGHIAHNCTLGSNIVVASSALVAGYVTIEDGAFLSGGVVVHQHSRIGRYAMIGGNTRVNLDAPPYFLYSGFDIEPQGLNLVGLRRNGFSAADIRALKNAYRLLYRAGLKLEAAADQLAADPHPHVQHLAEFVKASHRGICRPR